MEAILVPEGVGRGRRPPRLSGLLLTHPPTDTHAMPTLDSPPIPRFVLVARLAFLALAMFGGSNDAAAFAPAPSGAIDHGSTPREDPPHRHVWVKQTKKEWVPPKSKRVQVGTDAKGNPIYETRVVEPGFWRTVTFSACACGAVK